MKRYMYIYLTMLVLVACISTEVSVNGRLNGTVMEEKSHQPISNCLVSIDSLHVSVNTDANGFYDFGEICMGNYMVNYTGASYMPIIESVKISPERTTKKDVFLSMIEAPTVMTDSVSAITQNEATLHATIMQGGGSTIVEQGFLWGTSTNVSERVTINTGNSHYSFKLTNLDMNTTYYFQAYAKNQHREGRGDIISFTTDDEQVAKVKTEAATDITAVSAVLHGTILSMPESGIKSLGFYIGLEPQNFTQKLDASYTENKRFSCQATKLNSHTTYYYQAFLIYDQKIVTGEISSFSTKEITQPTVTTDDATDVKETTATLHGLLIADGNDIEVEYGFLYGTSSTELTNQIFVGVGVTPSFIHVLSGLTKGTRYYYQSYAKTMGGMGYGPIIEFETPDYNGHGYIDLKLPSGNKWALSNIGCAVEFDDCFPFPLDQYGMMIPWSSSHDKFQDLAKKEWGGSWRMPTKADVEELLLFITGQQLTCSVQTDEYWDFSMTSQLFGSRELDFGLPIYIRKYKTMNDPGTVTDIGFYWTSDIDTESLGDSQEEARAYMFDATQLRVVSQPISTKAYIRAVSK